jgi:hypothetical protein
MAEIPSNISTDSTIVQQADSAADTQDYNTAFDDYILAKVQHTSDTNVDSRCLKVLEQNTPTTIDYQNLVKAGNQQLPFDLSVQDTELSTNNTEYKTVLIVPRSALSTEIDDPVESWPFDRVAYVYSSHDAHSASLLCTIHFQTDDMQPLAERIGALMAVLDDVYATKMQTERADDSFPFHVWLCGAAPVSNGGEQWRNNIYFYDVADERSSIEWIREIAHEFSHLAFQPVGGDYTYPEAFANGYLGERLLVRWLARGAAGGAPTVEAAWKGTFSGYPNFNRLLIAPSLLEFSTHGLSKDELARRDDVGMRYLIGMMLDVDDTCGSTEVGTLLQQLADQHSSNADLLYDPVKRALAASIKSRR